MTFKFLEYYVYVVDSVWEYVDPTNTSDLSSLTSGTRPVDPFLVYYLH